MTPDYQLQLLFDGTDVKVYSIEGRQDVTWVSYGSAEFGAAFGLSYISKRGDAGLFLVPSKDHWYQTPEIWHALKVIRANLVQADRVVAYGSSMGGFAALAFSDQIRSDLIIAAAPQCSICPTVVGHFDRRWANVAERTKFERRDAREGLAKDANVVLIYDPLHREDKRNVEMLASVIQEPRMVPVPLGGHAVLHTLADLKLLKPLVDNLADDRLIDFHRFRNEFKFRRKSTHQYYATLAEYFERRRSHRRAAEFYLRSLSRKETEHAYRALTDSLWSLGYKEEAVLAAKRACELGRMHGGHWVRYSFALMDTGRVDEALTVLMEADTLLPDSAELLNAISIGLRKKGELRKALPYLQRAARMIPSNMSWQADLMHLEEATGASDAGSVS